MVYIYLVLISTGDQWPVTPRGDSVTSDPGYRTDTLFITHVIVAQIIQHWLFISVIFSATYTTMSIYWCFLSFLFCYIKNIFFHFHFMKRKVVIVQLSYVRNAVYYIPWFQYIYIKCCINTYLCYTYYPSFECKYIYIYIFITMADSYLSPAPPKYVYISRFSRNFATPKILQ